MRYLLTLFFLLSASFLSAQEINYEISILKPETHYAQVTVQVKKWQKDTLRLVMPVWSPGSYLVREYAKNVDRVVAKDAKGNLLTVEKINKNTWQILTKSVSSITIEYPIYCFETSVRTSFVDADHAFIHSAGTFMYVDGFKNVGGNLRIYKSKNFSKITTGLPQMAVDGVFSFVNYDQLADCPLEIGNHETFEFMAGDTKHTVALYGGGNYNVDTLKKDMAKVCQTAINVIGENPNKEYTFIIHNLVPSSGGLEHMNSCVLQVNRWTYKGADYLGFLGLVAHEYFHLWLVKRIRPIELGPFDYSNENYSNMLWAMEGWANYYADKIMYRAGYRDESQFLNSALSRINYVEGMPGSKLQSVAEASFDAWIKSYRPTENSANTTTSYYSKGAVLGAMLDLKIMQNTLGKCGLDDFLKTLYYEIYKKTGQGFSEKQFLEALQKYTGNIEDFYQKYILGTETIPYESIFDYAGISVLKTTNLAPNLGLNVALQNGQWIIKNIRTDGDAYSAGLNVNDEILALNGWRFSQNILNEILDNRGLYNTLHFVVSRDEHIKEFNVFLKSQRPDTYKVINIESNNIYKLWMKRN